MTYLKYSGRYQGGLTPPVREDNRYRELGNLNKMTILPITRLQTDDKVWGVRPPDGQDRCDLTDLFSLNQSQRTPKIKISLLNIIYISFEILARNCESNMRSYGGGSSYCRPLPGSWTLEDTSHPPTTPCPSTIDNTHQTGLCTGLWCIGGSQWVSIESRTTRLLVDEW